MFIWKCISKKGKRSYYALHNRRNASFSDCRNPAFLNLVCGLGAKGSGSENLANELRNGLIMNIETRFKYLIELDLPASKKFIIAAVSHPKFKLSWIPKQFSSMRQKLFIEECIKESENVVADTSISECSEEDFFKFFSRPKY